MIKGSDPNRPELEARRTTLKGGVGVFYQPPQFQETNPVFGTPGLTSNRAIHYSLGVEQEITRQVDVSLEGFYKDLTNQVSRAPNASGTYIYGNQGLGSVVGLEMLLKYKPSKRFFGWIAYTLSRSVRQDSPSSPEYLFQYDQTHNLIILGSYRLGRGWEFGGRFRIVSGTLGYAGGVIASIARRVRGRRRRLQPAPGQSVQHSPARLSPVGSAHRQALAVSHLALLRLSGHSERVQQRGGGGARLQLQLQSAVLPNGHSDHPESGHERRVLMRIVKPGWVIRLLGVFSLFLLGCGPDFDPPSELHSLRVLAVQKDVPYAQPGDTVNLQMLWQDASPLAGPDRKITIAWSPPCINPPGDLYYACFSDPDTFGDMVKQDPASPEHTSFVVPSNIISERPPPADGSNNPPYGLSYVFFAICAGELTLLPSSSDAAFPIGCKDADRQAARRGRLRRRLHVGLFVRGFFESQPSHQRLRIPRPTAAGVGVLPR